MDLQLMRIFKKVSQRMLFPVILRQNLNSLTTVLAAVYPQRITRLSLLCGHHCWQVISRNERRYRGDASVAAQYHEYSNLLGNDF